MGGPGPDGVGEPVLVHPKLPPMKPSRRARVTSSMVRRLPGPGNGMPIRNPAGGRCGSDRVGCGCSPGRTCAGWRTRPIGCCKSFPRARSRWKPGRTCPGASVWRRVWRSWAGPVRPLLCTGPRGMRACLSEGGNVEGTWDGTRRGRAIAGAGGRGRVLRVWVRRADGPDPVRWRNRSQPVPGSGSGLRWACTVRKRGRRPPPGTPISITCGSAAVE